MPSARDIAFVGCRLLALYVLHGILLTVMSNIVGFMQILAGSSGDSWRAHQYIIQSAAFPRLRPL